MKQQLFSRHQMSIIRRVAKEQQESFTRISDHKIVRNLKKELTQEGYDVNDTEILERMLAEIEKWAKVFDNPVNFINLLDDSNLGMIRHHLVNDYELFDKRTKYLHKLLNLKEKSNEHLN